mmetsp:Transcript_33038/g.67580  ORF Transcript_33038/g.67580 Transcript_33038/m.67580 type:complete len:626 (+) Transcript_33038:131-2008(+)
MDRRSRDSPRWISTRSSNLADQDSNDDSLSTSSPCVNGVSSAQTVRIVVVMIAYGLYYSILAGNQTVASLAEEAIGPTRFATMPIIAMFAGALLVVVPASKFMERFGRRAGFVVGGLAGVASSALAYASIKLKSFPLFLVAQFLLGIFDGFSDYLRFAASETVSASFQGYAISLAVSGGAVCSVLGPLLAQIATAKGGWGTYYALATAVGVLFCGVVTCVQSPKEEEEGRDKDASDDNQSDPLTVTHDGSSSGTSGGCSGANANANAVSSSSSTTYSLPSSRRESRDEWVSDEKRVSKVAAEEPRNDGGNDLAERSPQVRSETGHSETNGLSRLGLPAGLSSVRRPLVDILRTPECAVAIVCGMASQFAMVLVMTALPLGMVDKYDFTFDTYARTIQLHLVGMFVPGMASGMVVDRVGVVSVLFVGICLIGSSVLLGLGGVQLWNFNSCLVVIGVGWNLMSIGSTKLLLQSHSDEEAHSVQAAYEFATFAANAGASFVAGWSIRLEGGWNAVLVAATPLVAASLVGVAVLACRGGGHSHNPSPPATQPTYNFVSEDDSIAAAASTPTSFGDKNGACGGDSDGARVGGHYTALPADSAAASDAKERVVTDISGAHPKNAGYTLRFF